MYEQLTPDTQRHIQVLQRYMLAMERGDVDSIAAVLSEAQQDHALERMILEVNDFYQQEDRTLADPADVNQAHQLLTHAIPAMRTAGTEEKPVQPQDRKDGKVYESPHANLVRDSEPVEASNTMPARKASTQVLPSRRIAPQKWYRSRRNWLIAAIAAILVALLLLPNSAALANQLLSLFSVQQFQPVQVTKQDVKTLTSRPIPTFEDLGTLQIRPGSLQTYENLTRDQAAQMVSFPILLPNALPGGITGTPEFSVIGAGHATFTFSASKAHTYFLKNGYGNVHIPANLDGATFEITTSAGVVIAYGSQDVTQFMVIEVPSPVVRATGTASLQELRDVALSLPGLPSQLVTQLRQIDLNSGVVPVPIPSGIDSQSITVHGTTGLLLTSNISTTVEQLKKFPAGSAVVWQTRGIIYAVGGTVSNTNQLLNSANSLQ